MNSFVAKLLLFLLNILHADKDLTKSPSKSKDESKDKDKKDEKETDNKTNKKDESNIGQWFKNLYIMQLFFVYIL